MEQKKKPQLRRCKTCQKVGHNKSTCPEFFSVPKAPEHGSVKFFFHHLPTTPLQSAHVVNLKNERPSVWDNVQTVSPEPAPAPLPPLFDPAPVRPAKIVKTKKTFTPRVKTNRQKPGAIFRSTAFIVEKPIKEITGYLRDITSLNYWRLSWQGAVRDLRQILPWRRLAKITAVFALLLVVPPEANSYYRNLKLTTASIADNSTAGFAYLQESTGAILGANIPEAQRSIENALEKFSLAVDTMQKKNRWLQNIISVLPLFGEAVESRQNIISAGEAIAMGNTYIIKGLSTVEEEADKNITDRVAIITDHLRAAIPNYKKSLNSLSQVKEETLPYEYQSAFRDFRGLFGALVNDFQNISDLGGTIQEIFGGDGLRRYLLVFQNPHELRPTGGFMGSFALLEINDGQITRLDVPAGGSYDLQGQLDEFLEPPAPLLLSNKRWEFQDANWFPDFPASAEKILWFYRHSRNITADGVIAINATVLERLLAVTGPVTDEKRNLALTASTALTAIQTVVEDGPEKAERKPKQILADLAPKFLEYFYNIKPNNLMPLLNNLEEALAQKEIQVYFTDEQTQKDMVSFGWGGNIAPTISGQDYLLVVNTNIQGQKSDKNIRQTISHQAVVGEDGSILDSVAVTREHLGINDSDGLYDAPNIDYIRLYVPKGSELISASGFTWPEEAKFRAPDSWYKKDSLLLELEKEIKVDPRSGTRVTEEFGKTAFGNWIITEPGQATTVHFVYRLPFKAFSAADLAPDLEPWQKIFSAKNPTARYQLLAQKQSGAEGDLESQIIFPEGWTPIWSEGPNMMTAKNGAAMKKEVQKQDKIWSLIMKKE